jgi:hypothetical protein
MKQYAVYTLSKNNEDAQKFLNKKSNEGWNLIQVVPTEVTGIDGAVNTKIQAYMYKTVNKKTIID